MRIRFAGQRIEQPGENDLMGTAIDRMQHFTNQSPGKTSFHQRDAPQGVITVSGVFIAVTAALEPENRDNTTIGPPGNNRQSETARAFHGTEGIIVFIERHRQNRFVTGNLNTSVDNTPNGPSGVAGTNHIHAVREAVQYRFIHFVKGLAGMSREGRQK